MGDDERNVDDGVDDVNPPAASAWISQAEAARIRGVTRQAVSKLVEKGRFRTRTVAGRTLVHRDDVTPGAPTRPAASEEARAAVRSLERISDAAREEVFRWLLARHPVHPLEAELGADAEVILEAISRSADISKRGVRGLLAEAFFKLHLLDPDPTLEDVTSGEHAGYDFLIRRAGRDWRCEVKLARLEKGKLKTPSKRALKSLPAGRYAVAEVWRTRSGKDKDGEKTRPYRFDEFDLLAVSLHPATGEWREFAFIPAAGLQAWPNDATRIGRYQPVSLDGSAGWRSHLHECLDLLAAT